MYLYYLEKILRNAIREATNDKGREFALPYWNYSDSTNANARRIPLPFRQPADESNVLYVPNRDPRINDGGELPASAVGLESLRFTSFSSQPNSAIAFSGQFENTPHGTVHMAIGGGMGEVELAARDPVFWLHHTNIDRLWERWLSLGHGRSNPTGTQGHVWLTQAFDFFDADQDSFVTITGADVLHVTSQLGYTYDSLDGGRTEELEPTTLPTTEQAMGRPRVLADQDVGMPVSAAPVTVDVRLDVDPQELLGELVLHLDAMVGDRTPDGHYEVYINLADNEVPTYPNPKYVGNMVFFGFAPSDIVQFQYSLSEVEEHLRSIEAWDTTLRVTVVKTNTLPTARVEEDPLERDASPMIQILNLRVTRE